MGRFTCRRAVPGSTPTCRFLHLPTCRADSSYRRDVPAPFVDVPCRSTAGVPFPLFDGNVRLTCQRAGPTCQRYVSVHCRWAGSLADAPCRVHRRRAGPSSDVPVPLPSRRVGSHLLRAGSTRRRAGPVSLPARRFTCRRNVRFHLPTCRAGSMRRAGSTCRRTGSTADVPAPLLATTTMAVPILDDMPIPDGRADCRRRRPCRPRRLCRFPATSTVVPTANDDDGRADH